MTSFFMFGVEVVFVERCVSVDWWPFLANLNWYQAAVWHYPDGGQDVVMM